ncbi:MAG TPA: ribbon-helix-helix domain-containing protein [Actinomycetota bacterium]|nr:ribbon-helix-helix domain-containing protein [Actinomycetota bacterium]
MSEQIAVRIPDTLAESLEELVAEGRYETKAEAVRSALEAMVESERRRRIGDLIVEGYRRLPQDDEEAEATIAAAIRSIHEEPW